ncbi:hypothetical protein B0H17DRAFT_1200648 [Mycena rosella]|uniref:Uncharacterized protein n=1 Tax=Mycena rosella TaxID=1033263 RepID=A0AAD7DHT0_MYCRO|nr:hypothetical protein B0H17DRAFT_1200648 [Mycena rosella]
MPYTIAMDGQLWLLQVFHMCDGRFLLEMQLRGTPHFAALGYIEDASDHPLVRHVVMTRAQIAEMLRSVLARQASVRASGGPAGRLLEPLRTNLLYQRRLPPVPFKSPFRPPRHSDNPIHATLPECRRILLRRRHDDITVARRWVFLSTRQQDLTITIVETTNDTIYSHVLSTDHTLATTILSPTMSLWFYRPIPVTLVRNTADFQRVVRDMTNSSITVVRHNEGRDKTCGLQCPAVRRFIHHDMGVGAIRWEASIGGPPDVYAEDWLNGFVGHEDTAIEAFITQLKQYAATAMFLSSHGWHREGNGDVLCNLAEGPVDPDGPAEALAHVTVVGVPASTAKYTLVLEDPVKYPEFSEDWKTALKNLASVQTAVSSRDSSENLLVDNRGQTGLRLTSPVFVKKGNDEDTVPWNLGRLDLTTGVKEALEALMRTHDVLPLRVFDTEDRLVAPEDVHAKLKGALVEATIRCTHYPIPKGAQIVDFFSGIVDQVCIIKDAPVQPYDNYRRLGKPIRPHMAYTAPAVPYRPPPTMIPVSASPAVPAIASEAAHQNLATLVEATAAPALVAPAALKSVGAAPSVDSAVVTDTASAPGSPLMPVREETPVEGTTSSTSQAATPAIASTNAVASGSGSAADNDSLLGKRKAGKIVEKATPRRRMRSATPART